MKKFLTISVLALFLLSTLTVLFLVKTDRILLRAPVLFQEEPLVTYVVGKAKFKQHNDEPLQDLIVGTRLKQGAFIQTEKNSLVDIRLHRNTALRVAAETTLRIDYLSIRKLLLKVEGGSIFGKFKKLFDMHNIKINTPTSTASIRGTEIAIKVFKNEPEAKNKKRAKATNEEKDEELKTVVFGLSGILEVFKPAFREQTVLLSNRNKLTISQSTPPGNPEKMTDEEIQEIQSELNSLHYYEVLLISEKILFNPGSAKILKPSFAELDLIAKKLLKRDAKILIEGHTDNVGPAFANQTLSLNRAWSIQKYLQTKGVKPDMLQVTGYGESKPIMANTSKRGRARNRRVEFVKK